MVLTYHWLARVLQVLARRDEAHAQAVRAARCPHCGGPLHAAHYLRKAWGAGPVAGPPPEAALRKRWSWCCGRRGCRRRVTPESWRFHGRRFYVAPVVLVLAAQATGAAVATTGWERPDRRTVGRWREWWRVVFARSRRWLELLAHGMAVPVSRLPGALVAATGPGRQPLHYLHRGLELVRPWTGGAMR